jgi:hypothetical protein
MAVRKTETWKIVKDLVESMSIVLDGGSNQWVDNGNDTFTLLLCKTYWLDTVESIDISATIYTVEEVVNDVSITINATSTPVNNVITIPNPFFYSGTIVQTNEELAQDDKNVGDRTPMAYLFRDINDTFLPPDSAIERETPIRLFFLNEENFEDFTSEVNSEEVLEPMRQMAYYFVEHVLERSKLIGKIDEDYSIRDYSKFGTENASGYTNNIFNDKYSGVELNITLPIKKDYTCEC